MKTPDNGHSHLIGNKVALVESLHVFAGDGFEGFRGDKAAPAAVFAVDHRSELADRQLNRVVVTATVLFQHLRFFQTQLFRSKGGLSQQTIQMLQSPVEVIFVHRKVHKTRFSRQTGLQLGRFSRENLVQLIAADAFVATRPQH